MIIILMGGEGGGDTDWMLVVHVVQALGMRRPPRKLWGFWENVWGGHVTPVPSPTNCSRVLFCTL